MGAEERLDFVGIILGVDEDDGVFVKYRLVALTTHLIVVGTVKAGNVPATSLTPLDGIVRFRAVTLIHLQFGHVNIDTEKTPNSMPSGRWNGHTVGQEPPPLGARVVRVRPPALE